VVAEGLELADREVRKAEATVVKGSAAVECGDLEES